MMPAFIMVVFMVKMSFTRWSKLDEEESRREVTFMDREVAGGWYDYFIPTYDAFRFRNFGYNIPDPEYDRVGSQASSYVSIDLDPDAD